MRTVRVAPVRVVPVRVVPVCVVTVALTAGVSLSACATGLQDLPMHGVGSDTFTVTADVDTADGIVNGADVRQGQQVIGRVTDIALVDNRARLTLTLDDTVDAPENSTLRVELTSALGNPFLRLNKPEQPQGTLHQGSHISARDTSLGPQVESTLAALGNLMSGSGIGQLQSVMTSLNTAFLNRSDKVGDLIDTLNRLLAKSSRHTEDFNAALSAAADVSDLFVARQQVVEDFLDQTPAAVKVLAGQRERIGALMQQTTTLAANMNQIVSGRRSELNNLVGDARVVLDSLGTFNDNVGQTLRHMNSFLVNFGSAIRGDYLVFDGGLDIPASIDKVLTGGLFLSGQPAPTMGELRDLITGGIDKDRREKSQKKTGTQKNQNHKKDRTTTTSKATQEGTR